MVEHLNRQRVLNFLDLFCAGDIEGALARCSDELELIAPAPIEILPHMGPHRGKDAVRKMWQIIHRRYSRLRHEVREIVAEDDKVAASLRAFFEMRGSGRSGSTRSTSHCVRMPGNDISRLPAVP